jgi:hypothetical protein
MCLDFVKKTKVKDEGVGYQVFSINNGVLLPSNREYYYKKNQKRNYIPVNRWEKDKSTNMIFYTNCKKPYKDLQYESGFHIFLNLKDAIEWRVGKQVIRKVKYKQVVVHGFQYIYNKNSGVIAQIVVVKWRCVSDINIDCPK